MTTSILEATGWRQGSVVDEKDIGTLLDHSHLELNGSVILVVASQSCDIANDGDPQIEFSVSREIDNLEGNFTYNKNARKLHISIQISTNKVDILSTKYLELHAFEKISINKRFLDGLKPNLSIQLDEDQLHSYIGWLSARYSRPALPTSFNNMIRSVDRKGKIKKIAKSGNAALSGIYVQITPDREISDGEKYNVNLLGLMPIGKKDLQSQAQLAINDYAEILQNSGMDVVHAVRSEDEISVAVLRGYKRFYFDDLSYKENTPFPPEA